MPPRTAAAACRSLLLTLLLAWALLSTTSSGFDDDATTNNNARDLADLLSMLQLRQRIDVADSFMPVLVNPYTPYLLCDRHVGGEDDGFGEHNPRTTIVIHGLDANSSATIQACDVVCVDAAAFKRFEADILPTLPSRVILFTHRWRLPQVLRSNASDAVRANGNIFHWFAQNPIYPADDRYSPFPYGIRTTLLHVLAKSMLAYHGRRGMEGPTKNLTLEHPHMTPTHPSRKRLIARRAARARNERIGAPDYYARLSQAKFLISPRGDRPDTYRHWEAIALGAVPVANIDRDTYGPLFGPDMVYVNDTDDMLAFLDRPELLERKYHPPRSHLVSTLYWARRVEGVRAACRAQESV